MTLTIYDMLGQRERTFSMRGTPAGYHSVTWDATNDLGQQIGVGAYLRRIGSFVHLENGQNHYLNINLKTKSQLLYTNNQHTHYNSYKEFLYELCKTLKRKGLGYRKISYYLKEHGYKSVRGKELKNNSVYSILKKGKIKKDRIKNLKSHKDFGYTFETELTTV